MKDRLLFLQDTASRKLCPIIPLEGPVLKMYTCGPTVYDFAHLGNFRTFVCEDLLRRMLIWCGFRVIQVMNFTDIDDKIINKIQENGESLKNFTDKFKEAFLDDAASLRIQRAEHYPSATDYIQEMIDMIQELEAKGFAYQSNDKSVYFSIKKFPSYGTLCQLDNQNLQQGQSQRICQDEYDKDHIADFVLWKAYDPLRDGSVFWDSPWGQGRPGWHIECSAMAVSLLGKTLDIHCGGIDNIFPHHENEIAQSVCCHSLPLAKHWMHVAHLRVDGKKMAKSAGNFFTIREMLEKGADSVAIRFALLQNHYSISMNFNQEGLNAACQAVERYQLLFFRLEEVQQDGPVCKEIIKQVSNYRAKFWNALLQDLNMPLALSALFSLIREVHRNIDENIICKEDAKFLLEIFQEFDQILDLRDVKDIPRSIRHLCKSRESARNLKNWQMADDCRRQIESAGYTLEDLSLGYRIRKRK